MQAQSLFTSMRALYPHNTRRDAQNYVHSSSNLLFLHKKHRIFYYPTLSWSSASAYSGGNKLTKLFCNPSINSCFSIIIPFCTLATIFTRNHSHLWKNGHRKRTGRLTKCEFLDPWFLFLQLLKSFKVSLCHNGIRITVVFSSNDIPDFFHFNFKRSPWIQIILGIKIILIKAKEGIIFFIFPFIIHDPLWDSNHLFVDQNLLI